MGGALSNPVDESTKKEIQDLIETVLKTFTLQYTKAYTINLVQKLKEDAKAVPEDWKLLSRPECHDNLKTGFLMKEGGIRKSWKKRYFIVRWDYTVDYYETEAEGKKEKGKVKGTMGLAGYHVIEDVNDGLLKRATQLAEKMGMNVSELPKPKEYPKFTFEVHHPRRRCFYIRAENEEEFKQWVDIFKTACRNAYGLKNKEIVHQRGFHEAVRKTRWELGRWGWWSYGGNEEQILSDVISDQIDYIVMGRVYAKITGAWQVRNAIRNQVLKTLDTIVSAGVGPAWKAMDAVVTELRPQIEPKIKELVDPIGKAEGELQTKMTEAVMSIINPILTEHVTPHLGKIMEVIRSPMTDAYTEAYSLFEKKITEFQPSGNKDEIKKQFKELDWFPRSWALYSACDKTNVMYDPLWALNVVFKDIYPWGLIWQAHDELRNRMDNAIYTFEERLLKEMETEGADVKALVEKVKASVLEDYKTDGKKGTLMYYGAILKKIVMPPFNALVIPATKVVLDPLNSCIPDPVKQFIDLNRSFDELANRIIDESIATIVSS